MCECTAPVMCMCERYIHFSSMLAYILCTLCGEYSPNIESRAISKWPFEFLVLFLHDLLMDDGSNAVQYVCCPLVYSDSCIFPNDCMHYLQIEYMC